MDYKKLLAAKFRVAAIHGFLTLIIALITAAVVFYIWYPSGLAEMLGTTTIYLLVLGVELCLGPLMSLVIFNPAKPRAELVRDYCLVGLIQFSALGYGMYTTFVARPVYLVFVVDRIEVVSAVELREVELVEAEDTPYQKLPLFGPKEVCVSMPTDPRLRSDILLSALEGYDIHMMPEYYRPCDKGERLAKAYQAAPLLEKIETEAEHKELSNTLKDKNFSWLPVKSRFGAWIEVYPESDLPKAYYLEINPFL